MSTMIAKVHDFDLPWDNQRSDRKVLKSWMVICLGVLLVVGLPMPFLTLPEVEREELEALPPQLARIVMEQPKPKPPPPPPPKKWKKLSLKCLKRLLKKRS